MTRQHTINVVRHIAALECALLDACRLASEAADGEASGEFALRAGAAQVHVFDLGTVLRDLGEPSLDHARHGIAGKAAPDELLRELARESGQALCRPVPAGLAVLIRANLTEHRELAVAASAQSMSI